MTVYVEAVHAVRPLTNETFDEYVQWYAKYSVPAMLRSGYNIVGAWKRSGGELGRDVLLLRFRHVQEFFSASAALWKDAELKEGLAAAEGRFEISESVKLCVPVPYSPEDKLEAALTEYSIGTAQYRQAVTRLRPGRQTEFYALSQERVEASTVARDATLVVAYETTIGQRGEITEIWVSRTGWPLAYTPGDSSDVLNAQLREVAPDEVQYYLNPLPYSPLR